MKERSLPLSVGSNQLLSQCVPNISRNLSFDAAMVLCTVMHHALKIQFSHLPVKWGLLTVLTLLVESPALGKKSVPTQGCQSVMGENLSYLVSAWRATILPSYHMLGAQSPPKGSGTSKDNLLRMTQM